MSTHFEKGQRYIASLEAARIAGNWRELPELIRKVSKHASDRKLLVQVAKFEHDVANSTSAPSSRPGTATTGQPISDSQAIALENQLRTTGVSSEEGVQGQTALLWARWVGAYKTDRTTPVIPFEPVRTAADASSVWTKICVVKAVYIRALLYMQAGDNRQGKELLETLLPWLDANRSLVIATPQFLYWAQQILARIARGSTIGGNAVPSHDSATFRLQAFRHWAVLAARNQDVSPRTYGNVAGHLSKLEMLRDYYRFLSSILQNDQGIAHRVAIARFDLANELRRVETSYENELLRNLQFPKATETNAAVETWVEEFVRNWHILCGPGWSDADLGEGGRNSGGRNVLDMLYRAATKSFHSTLILRRLFQVHRALTDFDMAYKALDTYIELMERARARAATSTGVQNAATSRDSDEIFLKTVSEGIEGLCSFGGRKEAEKAYELSEKLEDLIDQLEQPEHVAPDGHGPTNGHVNGEAPSAAARSPGLVNTTYRAIGLGKAHWARWTPFSESRTSLQSEAIEYLQKAAAQGVEPRQQLKTLYTLARLLAETREVDQAIAVVKRALASETGQDGDDSSYSLQRRLMPFWHLLSLLLSSRQQFDTAGQSCSAAFEQFSPPEVLFGNLDMKTERTSTQKKAIVDEMECDEMQRIIEIRLSQIALAELIEGPEHAVNDSNDLLSLYSRLFERHGGIAFGEEPARKRSVAPPKSSHGTIRSFPSKLLHRKKPGLASDSSKGALAPSIVEETRPATQAIQTTQAPTIQVTNEDEKASYHKHKLFHLGDHHKESSPKVSHPRTPSQGEKGASRASSMRQSFESTHETLPGSNTSPTTTRTQPRQRLETIQSSEIPQLPISSSNHDTSPEAKQPLKEIPHNLDTHEKVPSPADHPRQPPEQDIRLPIIGPRQRTDPIPRFPRTISQRHALSILVKIWLVIATLYRRANMFEDSREACDEAAKVAQKIEGLIASVESSARAFSDVGWGGGGKSSDELWADVYFERAELLMTTARAREEKEGTLSSEGVREAVDAFEQCLMYFADHPGGIVGLSNVLLDYFERKVELAKRIDNGKPKTPEEPMATTQQQQQGEKEEGHPSSRPKHKREWSRLSTGTNSNLVSMDSHASATFPTSTSSTLTNPSTTMSKEDDLKKTPDNLNRLAARDRAYGLLSTLTKLGSGWDDSAAWFALARAHELGGEVDRAKEILWWCVELEDSRPIRGWSCLGGYVL